MIFAITFYTIVYRNCIYIIFTSYGIKTGTC